MSTTRWIDNVTNNLEEAISLILAEKINVEDSDTTQYSNWQLTQEFEEIQKATLNGREISFTCIRYMFDQIIPGDQPVIDRTRKNEGFIIPYSNGQQINYIISRNSNALRVLRKILGYTGKGEISKNMMSTDSDMFFWLISKVYSDDTIIYDNEDEESPQKLEVEMIRGFRGDTDDSLSQVIAVGETVMNIISTLSFFLESKNLNQIKIDLNYTGHPNIDLLLSANGKVTTTISKYIGLYNNDHRENSVIARLYLLIYIEIIPVLVQAYTTAKEEDLWNKEKNIEFLSNVASELSNRVSAKIDLLKR